MFVEKGENFEAHKMGCFIIGSGKGKTYHPMKSLLYSALHCIAQRAQILPTPTMSTICVHIVIINTKLGTGF